MHHSFGIFNASSELQTVNVVVDNLFGDKDSKLTGSFFVDYVSAVLPALVHYVLSYLDTAPSFKSRFIAWWVAEMVSREKL